MREGPDDGRQEKGQAHAQVPVLTQAARCQG
jgi:hypothetical protein